jgi:4-hydroxy-3-methylbut-2-enyl diphosphate reductase
MKGIGKISVEIDPRAGFCFGVTRVVNQAEEIIREQGSLYCLGKIVHNQQEIERLEKLGLVTISRDEYMRLSNCRVLIRAHGEPPETYAHALQNNIELIDGTCPIVLRLQSRIRKDFHESQQTGAQIVVFGKKDHAEVKGLAGQTDYQAIIVESVADIDKINFARPVHLYAQTTMSNERYQALHNEILARMPGVNICGQVSGRVPQLTSFCTNHDLILFVSYQESSNGRLLFSHCQKVNERSYFVVDPGDVQPGWFSSQIHTVGITGATSTPRWLLEDFARRLPV